MRFIHLLAAALVAALASGHQAAAEPLQLKLANPLPPPIPLSARGVVPWAEEVTQSSGGTLEIKNYPGATLASLVNVYDRILNGVADLGFGTYAPIATLFPKSNVVTLPFETKSGTEAVVAFWRIYEKGLVADEFGNARLLGLVTFPGIYVHTRKPIRTLADLQGIKLSADSKVLTRTLENLGAAPVHLTISEVYQALSRGMVDGSAIAWSAVQSFKLDEIVTHHLETPLGSDWGFVMMNKDSYAKLTGKAKEALDGLSYEKLARRLQTAIDGSMAAARARSQGLPGHVISSLPADEEARWQARVAPVVTEWTRETPDGARILAAFREEVQKVRAGM